MAGLADAGSDEAHQGDPVRSARIFIGDVRDRLRELPAQSAQTVVTSPPYWGLRDYGVAGQLGLEPTPHEYVENMVGVFREVRRVLRDDGTVWLNLGDSYVANGSNQVPQTKQHIGSGFAGPNRNGNTGLATKNLVGIPWRVAFALQADGWYLRSDIIWSKPNPMPESVTDRPTKAHEYIFLLSKSERYFYDAEAIMEQSVMKPQQRLTPRSDHPKGDAGRPVHRRPEGGSEYASRNKRTVWTVTTQPYPEAHFATYPEDLIEPCILAGSSEKGQCPQCGSPWERVIEHPGNPEGILGYRGEPNSRTRSGGFDNLVVHAPNETRLKPGHPSTQYSKARAVGWQPSCDHVSDPVPQTVLDPFCGSGTTGVVSLRHNRVFVGVELNPVYARMAEQRIYQDAPLFNMVEAS